MPPYLSKVAKLNKPILIVDAFAGPGKFEDSSPGSPLIICQAAEKHARDQYLAIFVNREKEDHEKLSSVLRAFIDQEKVISIYGPAESLLAEVHQILTDQTVFLYIDPFGLKGCEFSLLEPFIMRDKVHSTEIVINLSVPTIHRLAACKAVAAGRKDLKQIRGFNRRLTQVLGGDYWQEIMWNESLDAVEKVERVMSKYRENIQALGLPFTGSCPVREGEGKGIKYYITFCSRHPDAMLLMNDAMCSAYHQRMHEDAIVGTLFEATQWRDSRDLRVLEDIVLKKVEQLPGETRLELWLQIVQEHFMRYLSSEYKKAVKQLVQDVRIKPQYTSGTNRLNDSSRLHPCEYHST